MNASKNHGMPVSTAWVPAGTAILSCLKLGWVLRNHPWMKHRISHQFYWPHSSEKSMAAKTSAPNSSTTKQDLVDSGGGSRPLAFTPGGIRGNNLTKHLVTPTKHPLHQAIATPKYTKDGHIGPQPSQRLCITRTTRKAVSFRLRYTWLAFPQALVVGWACKTRLRSPGNGPLV